MGLFNLRRNDRVIDLSERYRRQKQKSLELQNSVEPEAKQEEPAAPIFPFFDSAKKQETVETLNTEETNERKKKLAKRLMDMTNKMEDLSNQIYHLTQRMEVLEKRTRLGLD